MSIKNIYDELIKRNNKKSDGNKNQIRFRNRLGNRFGNRFGNVFFDYDDDTPTKLEYEKYLNYFMNSFLQGINHKEFYDEFDYRQIADIKKYFIDNSVKISSMLHEKSIRESTEEKPEDYNPIVLINFWLFFINLCALCKNDDYQYTFFKKYMNSAGTEMLTTNHLIVSYRIDDKEMSKLAEEAYKLGVRKNTKEEMEADAKANSDLIQETRRNERIGQNSEPTGEQIEMEELDVKAQKAMNFTNNELINAGVKMDGRRRKSRRKYSKKHSGKNSRSRHKHSKKHSDGRKRKNSRSKRRSKKHSDGKRRKSRRSRRKHSKKHSKKY